jgi:tetratricopeptide (TPR) repeat protein
MLDMFRRHVWSKVVARGDGETSSRRHAELLADIAEEIESAFGSPDWLDLIRTLDSDHDLERVQSNFRRALSWSISNGETALASRLAGGLARYWRWRGRFEECGDWVDAVLAMPPEPGARVPRAKVLREAAGLARQTGRWEDANRMATEAAELFTAAGDKAGVADCLYDLGWGALLAGDFPAAERLFTESVDLWEQADDDEMASFPLVALAWIHKARGDFDGATRIWDRAVGDGGTLAARTGVTFWKADLEIDRGDLDAADEIARSSLAAATGLGFAGYASGARYVLARIALLRGDLESADALVEGAIEDARREASLEVVGFAMRLAVDVALEAGDVSEAERRLDRLVALVGRLGGNLGTATLAELRAGVLEPSRPDLAVALLAGTEALRAAEGLPLPEPDRKRYNARAERLSEVLGASAYEQALSRGGEMSVEELGTLAREGGEAA